MARVIMKRTVFNGQTYYVAHQDDKPIGRAAKDLVRKIKREERQAEKEREIQKVVATETANAQFLASVKTDIRNLKFKIGQKVRVKQSAAEHNTPDFWKDSVCEILAAMTSQILEENFYMIAHINGAVDTFRETELDLRFRKKPNVTA